MKYVIMVALVVIGILAGYQEAQYHAAQCQSYCATLSGQNICAPWLYDGKDYCVPVMP